MSATKTIATPTTENEIKTPEPSIPAARIPEDGAKKSLKDRMKKMSAAPAVEKPAASKRPEVDVPPEAEEAVRRWVPANQIEDIASKRAENANSEAKPILFKAFAECLWKNKAVPANPKIIVRDEAGQPEMSAIFQVQDRVTGNNIRLSEELKVTDDDEVNAAKIVADLVAAGIEKDDAVKFVANELNTSTQRGIRSLNELADGHFGADKQFVDATPEELAVAEKLMDFLDTLSAAEQKIIRRDSVKISVKKGFMARVTQYTHGAEQTHALLKVFEPTNFLSHGALGLGDDETTKVSKLQQAADEMIGSVQVK